MIYTVTMNPAIDYVVGLPSPFQPGKTNRSHWEQCQFGGKGINVSMVLQALDCETTALGFVAGFTGEALEQNLQAQGLATQFLHLSHGLTRINVKIKDGQESEINGRGCTISPEDLHNLYKQLDRLTDGDLLVLSGSVPPGLSADAYRSIMAHVSPKNIPVVVDASGALLEQTLSCKPFLVKPNLDELEHLLGKTAADETELRSMAKILQTRGARNVLVSLGADGALLLDETGTFHRIHCPKGDAVNTVGAGDSMVAGFLAGYLQTGDYLHSLRLATAAGCATAFCPGLAQKDQILSLMGSFT